MEIFLSMEYMHSLECVLSSHCVGGSKLVIRQQSGAARIPRGFMWGTLTGDLHMPLYS